MQNSNLENFKSEILKDAGAAFTSAADARKQGCCVLCGDRLDFTDWAPIDIREYSISGIGPCCFPQEPEED